MLVVGAGPTGLVLALSLARSGTPVRVVDRRSGTAGESRALDVQARTLELYARLGLADRIVARGVRIDELAVRSGGRRRASVDLRRLGRGVGPYPYLLCCPQDDHEDVLRAELRAAGVEVEWRTELDTVQHLPDSVRVSLTGPDGTSRRSEHPYVCGCDGGGSTVRGRLAVPFAGDRSSATYFVADVSASGPTARPASGTGGLFTFCLTEDDFFLVVPARPNGTHRVIGLVPAGLRGRSAVHFDDLRGAVERATATSVETVHWFSTYQVSSRVAERFRQGRVFLLGDAAHLHSPLGGQGMNTGVADAVNLAWKLAAVLAGRADAALLETFEVERVPVARTLVATTDRAFRLVDGTGRRPRWARALLFGAVLPAALRLPVVRTGAIGVVSQVRGNYRTSPLSSGRTGRVRGGDRLPWVPLADGSDNYAPLRSLDWQVHVYGTASRALTTELGRRAVPLHAYPWTRAARAAGLRRDAVYLVRPDGYLASALPPRRSERWVEALDAFAVVAGPVA